MNKVSHIVHIHTFLSFMLHFTIVPYSLLAGTTRSSFFKNDVCGVVSVPQISTYIPMPFPLLKKSDGSNNPSTATVILYNNIQYFNNKHALMRKQTKKRRKRERSADLTLLVSERVQVLGSIRVSYSRGLLTHLLLTSLSTPMSAPSLTSPCHTPGNPLGVPAAQGRSLWTFKTDLLDQLRLKLNSSELKHLDISTGTSVG